LGSTALGFSDLFLNHKTGSHPERPARLTAISKALQGAGIWDRMTRVTARTEPDAWILDLHKQVYVERLRQACENGDPFIDCPDSAICPASFEVAREAVSLTLALCDEIMHGRSENGFCAIRPPGHHAESDRSMGFCLFNNVAIACRYIQRFHRLKRVLVLDWDVHHGNGTQHLFEDDNTVFYGSLHQHPASCYPGTGWPAECGEGEGKGYTLNLPQEPGCSDAKWLDDFRSLFLPVARDFRPDFVLISAGFDAHEADPLAQLNLTEEAFAEMTKEMKTLSREFCQGRLLSVLEGGYNLGALGASVSEHVKHLM
jgi:acetoin utilization deacetylase AcuC-like enzyme